MDVRVAGVWGSGASLKMLMIPNEVLRLGGKLEMNLGKFGMVVCGAESGVCVSVTD